MDQSDHLEASEVTKINKTNDKGRNNIQGSLSLVFNSSNASKTHSKVRQQYVNKDKSNKTSIGTSKTHSMVRPSWKNKNDHIVNIESKDPTSLVSPRPSKDSITHAKSPLKNSIGTSNLSRKIDHKNRQKNIYPHTSSPIKTKPSAPSISSTKTTNTRLSKGRKNNSRCTNKEINIHDIETIDIEKDIEKDRHDILDIIEISDKSNDDFDDYNDTHEISFTQGANKSRESASNNSAKVLINHFNESFKQNILYEKNTVPNSPKNSFIYDCKYSPNTNAKIRARFYKRNMNDSEKNGSATKDNEETLQVNNRVYKQGRQYSIGKRNKSVITPRRTSDKSNNNTEDSEEAYISSNTQDLNFGSIQRINTPVENLTNEGNSSDQNNTINSSSSVIILNRSELSSEYNNPVEVVENNSSEYFLDINSSNDTNSPEIFGERNSSDYISSLNNQESLSRSLNNLNNSANFPINESYNSEDLPDIISAHDNNSSEGFGESNSSDYTSRVNNQRPFSRSLNNIATSANYSRISNVHNNVRDCIRNSSDAVQRTQDSEEALGFIDINSNDSSRNSSDLVQGTQGSKEALRLNNDPSRNSSDEVQRTQDSEEALGFTNINSNDSSRNSSDLVQGTQGSEEAVGFNNDSIDNILRNLLENDALNTSNISISSGSLHEAHENLYNGKNLDVDMRNFINLESDSRGILCTQQNLHKSMTATHVLNQWMEKNKTKLQVAFLHEPYMNSKKNVGGIPRAYKVYQGRYNTKVRAAIAISKKINSWALSQYSNEDITTIGIKSHDKTIILCSLYCPYVPGKRDLPPHKLILELTRRCKDEGWGLIIAADANSQNEIWGSTKTNDRGEAFELFITANHLQILNEGTYPTFEIEGREQVIDITLCNQKIFNMVHNWQVSRSVTMSDHNRINFQISQPININNILFRNLKNANWDGYNYDLKIALRNFDENQELDDGVMQLENIVLSSLYRNCKVQQISTTERPTDWWTNRLGEMKRQVNNLNTKRRRCRTRANSKAYWNLKDEYKKLMEQCSDNNFKTMTSELDNLDDVAKLHKFMIMGRKQEIGTIKDKHGNYTTTPKETLFVMLDYHFPKRDKNNEIPLMDIGVQEDQHELVDKIVTEEAIKASFESFLPHKSPGTDNIAPILIQKGIELLKKPLASLYKKSLIKEKCPKRWLESRATFIPKVGKGDAENPKSFRGINLSSFLLKGLERLISWHLQKTTMREKPLHKNVFSYRESVSTEDALHNLVSKIEKTFDKGKIAVVLFLDISSAFNNASVPGILNNMVKQGIDKKIIRWAKHMLENRIITATCAGEYVTIHSDRGTPQGGQLSAFKWNLNGNELAIAYPEDDTTEINIFADDGALIATGTDIKEIIEIILRNVPILLQWAKDNSLEFNLEKTKLMCFSRKRKEIEKPAVKINNVEIEWVDNFKYLGVTLEKSLNWKIHVEKTAKKANMVMAQCRKIIGRKYGLKPKYCKWAYISLVRPIMTYASVIWLKNTLTESNFRKLKRVQRLGCLSALNAMHTTPTAGMEVILNIRPIDIHLQENALKSHARLVKNGNWRVPFDKEGKKTNHSYIVRKFANEIEDLYVESDRLILKEYNNCNFSRSILTKEQLVEKIKLTPSNEEDINCFTDGSKTEDGTGCAYIIRGKTIKSQNYYNLNHRNSVFQAEVYAIQKTCEDLYYKRITDKNITIHIDSQAAIKAVHNYISRNKTVHRAKEAVNKLSEKNNVKLSWIPAHIGHAGNEIADRLAKRGAKNTEGKVEHFLPIPTRETITKIEEWGEKKHQKRWDDITTCRQTKMMCPKISNRYWKTIASMTRTRAMYMTQIFSGHATLQYHLWNMKIEETPICKFCTYSRETVEHFIAQCPFFARARMQIFREFEISKPLSDLSHRDIMKFVNLTKRFTDFQFQVH